MTKREAKRIARCVAGVLLRETARSTEIFEDGGYSDDDVVKLRAALTEIAERLLDTSKRA